MSAGIFSERAMKFQAGIFAVLDEKKRKLQKEGRTIYNLSVGTPDFPTPSHIMEAVSEAAKDPENPFALKLSSPAVKKEGLVDAWMSSATDLRGPGYPRLRDGKVNIGCYQCWLDPVGLAVTIR